MQRSKQEDMYIDIVQLISDIAKDSFNLDLINTPFLNNQFKNYLERNHSKLVSFIMKYTSIEPSPDIKDVSKQREDTNQILGE
jgi:hypothetical protein